VSRGSLPWGPQAKQKEEVVIVKRYQFIEYFSPIDEPFGYPVIADYGEDGPDVGRDAVWAWRVKRNGKVEGFDPTDGLRWEKDSEVLAEFDDLDQALRYLRREMRRFKKLVG
jgi:hypothetical protein